jgi:hypothetical protein
MCSHWVCPDDRLVDVECCYRGRSCTVMLVSVFLCWVVWCVCGWWPMSEYLLQYSSSERCSTTGNSVCIDFDIFWMQIITLSRCDITSILVLHSKIPNELSIFFVCLFHLWPFMVLCYLCLYAVLLCYEPFG